MCESASIWKISNFFFFFSNDFTIVTFHLLFWQFYLSKMFVLAVKNDTLKVIVKYFFTNDRVIYYWIYLHLVPHLGFIIPTRSRRTINRFLAHNVLLPVNRTRWIYNPLAFYLPNVRSEPEHRLNREIKPCNNSKTFISL